MENSILQVLFSFLGSLLLNIATWLPNRALQLFGDDTGDWIQHIPQDVKLGEPDKEDHLRIQQLGRAIFATIWRNTPVEETKRKWRFKGMHIADSIFGHFWNTDRGDPSFGTIFLRQISRDHFSGFYVRFHLIPNNYHEDTRGIERLKLSWKKKP